MMNETYKKILDHYGKASQKLKAIEELEELIKAIENNDLDNIKEEIADVVNMLAQLLLIYKIDKKEIYEIMRAKNKRTIERMK